MDQKADVDNHKNAYTGILLLGIVSLMGDIVYEGSRGLVPDYLQFLGATAIVAGLVGGLGDFLGYAMRMVSGFLVDMTRSYWLFIFLGYGLIVSVPLLGIAPGLEMAILLVLLERFGKAIRSPSRDTVLSMISKDVGAGKAFGLHELLDQIGAIIGPLTVAVIMLSTNNDYHYAFGLLFIPFVMLSVFLTHTYRRIRSKTVSEAAEPITKREKLTKPFYIYTFAVLLNALGLIPPALILFKASEILRPLRQDWIVPLIYLLIQGVDAPAALLSGYAFDKFGIKLLIVPFLLSLFATLFAMFDSGLTILLVASVFSGLVLGMQESIYRAAVSNLAPMSARGTAYGVFHAVYGLGLLVGGGVYGFFIDIRLPLIGVIVYVAVMQSTAVASLLKACSRKRTD